MWLWLLRAPPVPRCRAGPLSWGELLRSGGVLVRRSYCDQRSSRCVREPRLPLRDRYLRGKLSLRLWHPLVQPRGFNSGGLLSALVLRGRSDPRSSTPMLQQSQLTLRRPIFPYHRIKSPVTSQRLMSWSSRWTSDCLVRQSSGTVVIMQAKKKMCPICHVLGHVASV